MLKNSEVFFIRRPTKSTLKTKMSRQKAFIPTFYIFSSNKTDPRSKSSSRIINKGQQLSHRSSSLNQGMQIKESKKFYSYPDNLYAPYPDNHFGYFETQRTNIFQQEAPTKNIKSSTGILNANYTEKMRKIYNTLSDDLFGQLQTQEEIKDQSEAQFFKKINKTKVRQRAIFSEQQSNLRIELLFQRRNHFSLTQQRNKQTRKKSLVKF